VAAPTGFEPVFAVRHALSPSILGNLGRVEYTGKTPALERAAVFARAFEDLAAGMKQRIESGSRAIGHREA